MTIYAGMGRMTDPKLLARLRELRDAGLRWFEMCTCGWSPVNVRTEEPPHRIWCDSYCPVHGGSNASDSD